MLRGIWNLSGDPAGALPGVDRLGSAGERTEAGPLAVAAAGGSRPQRAQAGEITCLMSGRLFEPAGDADALGLAPVDGPALIAEAYRRAGAGALAQLRGSFSVAIWDQGRREGVLVCDRLATTPLFIWRGSGRLAFAGELAALLELLPTRPAPDATALAMWLGDGAARDGRTLYDGVTRLGPGELWALTERSAVRRVHWRPRYVEPMAAGHEDLAEALRHEIERSVRRRMSPESTAVILSGGLDSSIVAALAARVKPPGSRLATYSTVFPGSEFDESEKIRELTATLDAEAAAVEVAPQGTLWLALEYLERRQLPLIGAGALIDIPVVREAAGDGARIVLDGQTGDETLGFSPYLLSDALRRGRLGSAVNLARRWPIGYRPTRRQLIWILAHVGLEGAVPVELNARARRRHDPAAITPVWMLPRDRAAYLEHEDPWQWKTASSGPLWWRYLSDLLVHTPHRDTRLDFLRHRAQDAGVETASPLYDADLLDFVLRLPPHLAFDSRFTRPLARESVRGIVPDAVRLQGKKAVFSDFCLDALTGADLPGIEDLVLAPGAELAAYVEIETVRRFWREQRPRPGESTTEWGTMAWRFAVAEAWLRYQRDPGLPAAMLARPDVRPPRARRTTVEGPALFVDWRPVTDAPKI